MSKKYLYFLAIIALLSCNRDDKGFPPKVVLEVFPLVGDSLTPFHFDLRQSSDAEDVNENLDMEFDWNNDGIWDTLIQGVHPIVKSFIGGGWHTVSVRIIDRQGNTAEELDSVYVFPKPVFGEMTDPRDNQSYKTVYLESHWWLAEHLRFGKSLDTSENPSDNQLSEYYLPDNHAGKLEQYGGLYTWQEAMNYDFKVGSQGVCPPGWHIPASSEWEILGAGLQTIFISYYYGPNGPGGLNLESAGTFLIFSQLDSVKIERQLTPTGEFCSFWSSTFYESNIYVSEGRSATREFRKGYLLSPNDNSMQNPYNVGFITSLDVFHIKGNVYLGNHEYSYHNTAKSVRCIKDY